MKSIIDQLTMGKIEYEKPEIAISVAAIEERVEAGRVYEGQFTISSVNGLVVKGNLYGSNARIRLLDPVISGTEILVRFEIDTTGLMGGSDYSGRIYFISNGGEFIIPVTLTILECVIESTLGKIENYFHFANLVQTNYEEALKLFTSPDFERIIEKNDLQHLGIYEGLKGSVDKQLAMEEFLISIHKKKPVVLTLDRNKMEFEELSENYQDMIILTRSTWGYVNVQVEVRGSFLTACSRKINQENFTGNRMEYTYLIDTDKLYEGHNYGQLVFHSYNQTLTFDVVVHYHVKDRRIRAAIAQNTIMANQKYLDFRMKRSTVSEWTNETVAYMNNLIRLDEHLLWPYLVKAQVLLSMEKQEEAVRILDYFIKEQFRDAQHQLDLYCYYLYVRSLEKREAVFTANALEEVKGIYNRTGSDVALWVILYMDERYDLNRSLKYTMIKEQFRKGTRSPRLYFEALNVLNDQPRLLRVLNTFELQILLFGARNDCLNKGLIGQLVELALLEKKYNATLFEILKRAYQKQPDVQTLTALCSTLIRGSRIGEAYLPWYQAGIEADVRLTNLYEYYMFSLPADYSGLLPNIIYMYFIYNSEVLGERRSFLFCNIINNKKKLQSIYQNYLQIMEQYLVDALLKGKMDRELSIIYQDILKSSAVHSDVARNLTDVVMTNELRISEPYIREVAVIHKEMLGETIYKITDRKAYVSLYTEDAILIFIDHLGRRYCNITYQLEPLLDMQGYLKDTVKLDKNQLPLLLYFAEKYIKYRKNPLHQVECYQYLLDSQRIRVNFKLELLHRILEYYRDEKNGEGLDNYLLQVDFAVLDRDSSIEIMNLMLKRALYPQVYELMKQHGYAELSVRGIARCLTLLLSEEVSQEPFFLELCQYVYQQGKYNEAILSHLCEHFNGSVEQMCALWKTANDFFYENHVLEERILTQIMFTQTLHFDTARLMASYFRYGVGKQVRTAFYVYCSYLIFMHRIDITARKQLSYIYQFLELDMLDGMKVPRLCRVALAEYGAGLEQMSDRQKEFYQALVIDLANRNLIFEFYKRYNRWFELPFFVMDQTVLDYRTMPGHQVSISYTLGSQGKATRLLTEDMESILPGVYVKIFTLFYGDRLEYFFNDTDENETTTTASFTFEMRNPFVYTDGSRYSMLNSIIVAGNKGENEKQSQLIEQYLEKQRVAEKLFYIF